MKWQKRTVNLFDRIGGHIIVRILFGFSLWFYFRIIYRKKVKIIGKENVVKEGRVLYFANHLTMMDPILLPSILFFPKAIFRPKFLPWTPAARENFFPDNCHRIPYLRKIPLVRDSSMIAWIMKHGHALPVQEGRKDPQALKRMIEIIDTGGSVLIFPEGTRSRDGRLGQLRPGITTLIKKCNPGRIVPIIIIGADKILPIGQIWPDWSKGEITIIIGRCIKSKILSAKVVNNFKKLEGFKGRLHFLKKKVALKISKRQRILEILQRELLQLKSIVEGE